MQVLAQERPMSIIQHEKDSVQIEPEHQMLYRQLLPEFFYYGGLIDEFNFRRLNLYQTPLLFS